MNGVYLVSSLRAQSWASIESNKVRHPSAVHHNVECARLLFTMEIRVVGEQTVSFHSVAYKLDVSRIPEDPSPSTVS
jgi:hypothetical protein